MRAKWRATVIATINRRSCLNVFSALSLNARKARSARLQPLIGRRLGVGGRKLSLIRHPKSHATLRASLGTRQSLFRRMIDSIKRREVGAQDKMLGVALTAQALREGRACPLTPEFILHINELTLAVQNAGIMGKAVKLATNFVPLEPLPTTLADSRNFKRDWHAGFLERRLEPIIDRLHKH